MGQSKTEIEIQIELQNMTTLTKTEIKITEGIDSNGIEILSSHEIKKVGKQTIKKTN